MTALNLIVLRASDPIALTTFYGLLGVAFTEERHGSGPAHYSAAFGEVVLEIYPKRPGDTPTSGVVLGFSVKNLEGTLLGLNMADGVIISPPVVAQHGRRATITDPAGHKVILVE
jgi:predicted enzyme related to lactoylglutathione lyase